MTFIIVGFKVSEENSVHCAKVPTLKHMTKSVTLAFRKGADFVRVIRYR